MYIYIYTKEKRRANEVEVSEECMHKKKERDEEWTQAFYQRDEHSWMNAWKFLSDEDLIHACNFLFIDNEFNSVISMIK